MSIAALPLAHRDDAPSVPQTPPSVSPTISTAKIMPESKMTTEAADTPQDSVSSEETVAMDAPPVEAPAAATDVEVAATDAESSGTAEPGDRNETSDESVDADPFVALPPALRKALESRGFDRLTRVQQAALEALNSGRDLQVSSQTGSGKTVALGLVMAPSLIDDAEANKVPGAPRPKGPRALVIAPTRELATQVRDELDWLFAGVPRVNVVSVTGGTSVDRDRTRLRSAPAVLVGTPGRLLDHIRNGALDCSQVRQMALDEADQMLDMGFREELESILDTTPEDKHTHLVSATFPHAIRRLAERYQKNPLHVEGTRLGAANEDIEHIVYAVHPSDRYGVLINTLLLAQGERTLIFVKTRQDTADLAEQLSKDGFSAMPISGDLQQGQRTRTLAAFRNGTVDILVATDVAARGLDIPDVGLVVHGTPPMDSESYTHRSGRTGRAGNKGRCIVLAPYFQRSWVSRLLHQARVKASWEEPPNAKRVQKALVKNVRRQVFHALEQDVTPSADLLDYATRLLNNRDPATVVATLLKEFQPKPPTQPRDVGKPPRERRDERFGRDRHPRDRGRDRHDDRRRDDRRGGFRDDGDRGPRPRPSRPSAGYTRFGINWGQRQGANPKRLLAVICRRGDINGRKVGSIQIDTYSSSFEVRDEVADHFAQHAERPDSRDPKIRIKKL